MDWTRIQPIVRTAKARMSGFGSLHRSVRQSTLNPRLALADSRAQTSGTGSGIRGREWVEAGRARPPCVLDKSVHGHDGQFRLCFGIVDEIEINEFANFQVGRHHIVHHSGKQARHVLAERHVSDDLLDGVALLILVVRRQLFLQLGVLTAFTLVFEHFVRRRPQPLGQKLFPSPPSLPLFPKIENCARASDI